MLHSDRARAGSFGGAAQEYDRYRPGYPDAFIDDLARLRPVNVLDVGCGTGKAAVALAARGLAVLGVEADPRMAELARGHGVEVEVATFEAWDAAGRTFDLVTCGEAWHWIDPALGVPKLAQVLSAGGTVARFWTSMVVDDDVVEAFDLVYRRYAPEVAQVWRPGAPRMQAAVHDALAGSEAFTPSQLWSYQWEETLTAAEWAGRAGPVSDHRRLEPERRAVLLRALRTAIDGLGGTVHARHETYALCNRRR
jgi:SAM-dependent methyltransferase